jgi:glucuronoarabinoxylan endo-1,4-beta-xylanase
LLCALPSLYADELTLQANGAYVALNAANALTASAQSANAQTFDRLYPGNGYFYLRAHGGDYVAVDATSKALSATAATTVGAEQFVTVAASSGSVWLQARTSGIYVAIDASNANVLKASATAGPAATFQAAASADASPYVEIDLSNLRQEIVGFGASIAFYNNWLTAHPNKEAIYKLFFDPVDGLGASILRVQNNFSYSTVSAFDPDTFEEVQRANLYRGAPITVLMSSWTPPASLKANNNTNCAGGSDPGCTLAKKNGSYVYSDYAKYWYDSLVAYRAYGVAPNYVSLQNELDFTPSYVGCRFNPTEAPANGGSYASYTTALDTTYKLVQGLTDPPTLVGPETFGIGYGNIQGFLAALNPAEIGAVAHHLYTGGNSSSPDSFNSSMLQVAAALPGKPIFQTEYYANDVANPSTPASAFNYAWLIHNSMAAEETSAYLYWSFFWVVPDTGQLVVIDNPFNPTSSWTYPPNGYAIHDQYYALKHFSRFVQPGYRRVTALTGSAALRVSAYIDTQTENLVYVLINTSSTGTLTPALQSTPPYDGAASVYRSVFAGSTERFSLQGPLGVGNTVALPPLSVATVVIGGTHRLGVPAPGRQPPRVKR